MDHVNQNRRIAYFERLGEAAVRADLDAGFCRYVGRDDDMIQLARRWLDDREMMRRAEARRRRREDIARWALGVVFLAFAATFFRI